MLKNDSIFFWIGSGSGWPLPRGLSVKFAGKGKASPACGCTADGVARCGRIGWGDGVRGHRGLDGAGSAWLREDRPRRLPGPRGRLNGGSRRSASHDRCREAEAGRAWNRRLHLRPDRRPRGESRLE